MRDVGQVARLRPRAPPAGAPRFSPKFGALAAYLGLGRHNRAPARLLGAAAPDLGAVAEKLDLILRHSVFELSFGEAALGALRRDVRGFAGLG